MALRVGSYLHATDHSVADMLAYFDGKPVRIVNQEFLRAK
jgi:hypothetical protein